MRLINGKRCQKTPQPVQEIFEERLKRRRISLLSRCKSNGCGALTVFGSKCAKFFDPSQNLVAINFGLVFDTQMEDSTHKPVSKAAAAARQVDLQSLLLQDAAQGGDAGIGGAGLRAFNVLEAAAHMRRDLSVSELSALVDVPKPTMHRLVRQLEKDGLLQRGVSGRLRGPGPRLVNFALDVLRYWAEAAPRQALLQALSSNVGETCNLGVMEGNAIVYIERVESKWPFGLKFEPGSKVHCIVRRWANCS